MQWLCVVDPKEYEQHCGRRDTFLLGAGPHGGSGRRRMGRFNIDIKKK